MAIELLGRLRLAGGDLLAGLGPGREQRRALAERGGAGARAAQEQLADLPLAGRDLFDRDIFDGRRRREPSRSTHLAAEQLGDHAHLAAALLEAAQVDEAGGDDLARSRCW